MWPTFGGTMMLEYFNEFRKYLPEAREMSVEELDGAIAQMRGMYTRFERAMIALGMPPHPQEAAYRAVSAAKRKELSDLAQGDPPSTTL